MHLNKYALLLPAALCMLLSGCTDIRSRLSPDLLAVDAGARTALAAHSSQAGGLITAETSSPLLMPDALRISSGAEISTGHLSLLIVSGQPGSVTAAYLQRGWLAPTCAVFAVPEDACGMLADGRIPAAEQLQAAVSAGLLPCRTADAVTGDLLCGSGVTAFPSLDGGRLTLALCQGDALCGTLSQSACRGLALLGRRWDTFTFSADGAACSVRRTRLKIGAAREDTRLHFTVTGTVCCETVSPDAAAAACEEMLCAALTETAQQAGADLCFLRENALRCGIGEAADCTPDAWQEMLRSAAYSAEITVTPARFVQNI